MSTVIYEFTANHATELWSTNPEKMVDGTETSYASTTTDGDIQCLITNECVGTDLGTISKVEIRAYAYSDDNDQLILRPVFGGSDDGDNHTTVPGVDHGWGDWQDITSDTNTPGEKQSHTTGDDTAASFDDIHWKGQSFTTGSAYDITAVSLLLYRIGSPGTITVSIWATDENGRPTGGDLCSGTTDGDTLTTGTSGEWRTISFGSPASLSGSTVYAIVVGALGAISPNDGMWRADTSAGYANGKGVWTANSGVDWSDMAAGYDFMFITFGAWSWSDIQDLDCDVGQNDVSKGNTMYCGMVVVRVTYTAEAPPEGVPVQMMHYARMRRR